MYYHIYQNNEEQNASIYREARRRVNAKLSFFRGLLIYLFVNSIVFSIWLSTQNYALKIGDDFHIYGWSYPWFLWVMIPGAVVLIIKFLNAFVLPGRYDRQQMLENELHRLGVAPHSYPSYSNYPVTNPQEDQK